MTRRPERAGAPRRPPAVVVALAAVGLAFFALPLVGLAQRAPWSQLWDQLHATATTCLIPGRRRRSVRGAAW